MVSDLKNPMCFSIRNDNYDIAKFGVDVTEIEIKPSEGNLYVYWE